jgi:nitrogen fixation/metabolism regulation signal transduction histidine kinase
MIGSVVMLAHLPPAPERRFDSAALDALATAVIFAAVDYRVIYANSAAENLFKLSNTNVRGHTLGELFADDSALVNAIKLAAERNCSLYAARAAAQHRGRSALRRELHRHARTNRRSSRASCSNSPSCISTCASRAKRACSTRAKPTAG